MAAFVVGRSISERTVLLDSGAFVARADPADQHHHTAVETFQGLKDARYPLCVTRPTLWETFTRLRYKVGFETAIEVFAFVAQEGIEVVDYADGDEINARAVLSLYRGVSLSFVDALNRAISSRLGLNTAFAYDGHYRTMGFDVYPQI